VAAEQEDIARKLMATLAEMDKSDKKAATEKKK
jgi:hypothetical protein